MGPIRVAAVAAALLWAGVANAEPVKAVVITGDHPFNAETFLPVFQGHEAIEFTHAPQRDHEEIIDDVREWPYDVMVFYHFSMEIPAHRLQNLLALIHQGVGLVLLHHGGMTYWNTEALRDVYGIRWNPPDYSFHGGQEYTVRVADPDHPITQGLTDFQVLDETYLNFSREDYPGNHVLLTADHPKSDKVIGWVRKHGPARVAGLQLGHDTPVFEQAEFRTLIERMTLWAAGRLPEAVGGEVLAESTLYRETREAWLDRTILESPSGGPQTAHDIIHARVLAAIDHPELRSGLVARLSNLLAEQGHPDGTRFILRQLAYLRPSEHLGPVIALLDDPVHAQMARRTLEEAPGEEVDAALIGALQRSEGDIRLGLMNTLAKRGAPGSVEVLTPYLGHSDPATARGAVDALAWLGTPAASQALLTAELPGEAREHRARALVRCGWHALQEGRRSEAHDLFRKVYDEPSGAAKIHAFWGLLEVSPNAQDLALDALEEDEPDIRLAAYHALAASGTGEAVAGLSRALDRAPTQERHALLAALGATAHADARPAIKSMLQEEDPALRIAALKALTRVGTPEDLEVFFAAALGGTETEQTVARAALARLPDADAFLLARLAEGPAAEEVLALQLLAERQSVDTVDRVSARTSADDPAVRAAAWLSAGALTDPEDLPRLLEQLRPDEPEVEEAQVAALAALTDRAASPDAAVDTVAGHAYLDEGARSLALRAVAVTGTDRALVNLQAALKADSPAIQAVAVEALAAWPDARSGTALLSFAETTTHADLREKALQGAAPKIAADTATPPGVAVDRLRRVLETGREHSSRLASVNAFGRIPSEQALTALVDLFDDPDLAAPAMVEASRLATIVAGDSPEASASALRAIIDRAEDEGIVAEAKTVLANLDAFRKGLLAQWNFSQGTDGWTADSHCTLTVEDGFLVVESTGPDPFLSTETHVPAGPALFVIRGTFDMDGIAQVFLRYQGEGGYSPQSQFIVFEFDRGPSTVKEYRVPVNFEKPLTGIRLDPGMSKGMARIDYIRLMKPEE